MCLAPLFKSLANIHLKKAVVGAPGAKNYKIEQFSRLMYSVHKWGLSEDQNLTPRGRKIVPKVRWKEFGLGTFCQVL